MPTVALYTMKLGLWDLPSDPVIIDKSNNGIISSTVDVLRSRDPVSALLASSLRSAPTLDCDYVRAALAMYVLLIFDRGSGSWTVIIAIARHINFRDLAMQGVRRLDADNSFTCGCIHAKPTAA
jgi:hypothetical protein